jgi:DNA-binding response OmpR family regulator
MAQLHITHDDVDRVAGGRDLLSACHQPDPLCPRAVMSASFANVPVRVGVCDRDTVFAEGVTKRLGRMGWECIAMSGSAPVERLIAMRLGAFVVDLAHLGADAWPYLERVTAELPTLPIVICTGQSTVAQRVRGLRLGADDWLTKPCHPEELIARVEAVTRRRRHANTPSSLTSVVAGDIEIRADQFQAFANGTSLDLTPREYELLALLAAAEGRVLERDAIYQRIWGYTMAQGDRSVDVFVRKVRAKLLAVSPGWSYIHTHFGIGYRFNAEPANADAPRDPSPETVATPTSLANVPTALGRSSRPVVSSDAGSSR